MIHLFAQPDRLGVVWEHLVEALLTDNADDHLNLCFGEPSFEARKLLWSARRFCDSLLYYTLGNRFESLGESLFEQTVKAEHPTLYVSNDIELNMKLMQHPLLDQSAAEGIETPDIVIVQNDGKEARMQVLDLVALLADSAAAGEPIMKVLLLASDRGDLSLEDGEKVALSRTFPLAVDHLLFRERLFQSNWLDTLVNAVAALDVSRYRIAHHDDRVARELSTSDLIYRARFVIDYGIRQATRSANGSKLMKLTLRRFRKQALKVRDTDVILLVSGSSAASGYAVNDCFFLSDNYNFVSGMDHVTPMGLKQHPLVLVSGAELKQNPGYCFAAVYFSRKTANATMVNLTAWVINLFVRRN